MALFGKKQEEEGKGSACAGDSGRPASEIPEITKGCCPVVKDGIWCIKVLGSGCASCHALYENTKEAVQQMGLAVEAEYVTDLQKIMEYGVMSMPALIVNEKIAFMGKVLKSDDVEKLLRRIGFQETMI